MASRGLTKEEFSAVSYAIGNGLEAMRLSIVELPHPHKENVKRLAYRVVLNALRKEYIRIQRTGGDSYGFLSLEELYRLIEDIDNGKIELPLS